MSQEAVPTNKNSNIVVGFDFSELAERAIEEALAMAARRPPTTLHIVVVTLQSGDLLLLPDDVNPVSEATGRETVRLRVTKMIDEYHTKRGPTGIDHVVVYVLRGLSSGHTGQLIAGVAKDVDAELIVVGSHGRRGIERMLLGSVAERVVREARTSVYVVRPSDFVGDKKVPAIEAPLAAGQPHLKEFEHRHTYRYVDRSAQYTSHCMPVT